MTTLADACTRWIAYRERMVELSLVAPTTRLNQSQIVASSIMPALGAIELSSLRKSDVDIFIGERLMTHAPVTVRAELNVLRQILNWCVDETVLGARPRLPMVQVPNVESSLPSDEAFVWAIRAVPENHRGALELMMLTGLSPHEAERVQVRDFNPASPIGTAIGVGQRPDFRVKTASRKRMVPLNKRARELWVALTSGKRPLDPAFPSSCAMQKALARARAADPKAPDDARRITPKLMRQWFASKLAGEETPEHILQRLLGHSPGSKITRRHYVRSGDQQLQEAVGGLRELVA